MNELITSAAIEIVLQIEENDYSSLMTSKNDAFETVYVQIKEGQSYGRHQCTTIYNT